VEVRYVDKHGVRRAYDELADYLTISHRYGRVLIRLVQLQRGRDERRHKLTIEPISNRHGGAYAMLVLLAAVACAAVSGCGTGSSAPTGGPASPPQITQEPIGQSVPMGLAGSFQVKADGQSLSYQWTRNGVAVGSSSPLYATPPTQFTDEGSVYAVTVSNSKGSVASTTATLHITARAPLSGDLRFQQIDAPSTINGYPGLEFTNISGPGTMTFTNSSGTAPLVGPNCGISSIGVYDCNLTFDASGLPASVSGLNYGFVSAALGDFQGVLSGTAPGYPYIGALDSPNRVIASVNIEPQSNAFSASWIESTANVLPFTLVQNEVALSAFQVATEQEGEAGRVITAVTYDGPNVHYFSYGWQGDPSTIYETQVSTASLNGAAAAATTLSNGGYMITAFGGDAQNGVIMVGTRVRGDTMPRPILVEDALNGGAVDLIPQNGYATVGWVYNISTVTAGSAYTLYTAIGQR
jgi:hypothetical protein